ncbi:stage III sporulation protein AC [Clostridium perfringens]|nr:stage III sporulation protein AC [Clostridium perfringens]
MSDLSLIFQIAGVGIVLVILDKVLDQSGKKEYATLANIVGVVIILTMMIQLISRLFSSVKSMFLFFNRFMKYIEKEVSMTVI